MADPAAVDAAVIAALTADTGTGGLMTMMTDGAYMDIAPPGRTKFVIVSLVTHEDVYAMGGWAYEKFLYLVKAVDLNTKPGRANAAAARILEVLQDVALSITGYDHMLTQREERIAYTEVDSINPDIRWQHRGGRFEVFVSPSSVAVGP